MGYRDILIEQSPKRWLSVQISNYATHESLKDHQIFDAYLYISAYFIYKTSP